MRYTFRFVNSIENLDPQLFNGQILITPDGSAYLAQTVDELGGIGDFFKKLGSIALPLVGTIAAPFTGGMSLALTSAINAGGAIGAGLLGGIGGGGNSQQAKGLAAIQAKGQEVISAFETLKQKITSDANFTKADAYTAADKLVAILSNSTEFYQAQKGKDAEALASFKQQAAQLAAQTKTFADAADAAKRNSAQTANGAGGQLIRTVDKDGNIVQTVQPAASNLPFGLSMTELLIGGVAAYFLFFRNSN